MYGRFTDRARRVMMFANQEAHHLGHEFIGTEHILLGLLKEGYGVGANVLKDCGLTLEGLRAEIEKVVIRGPQPDPVVMGRLPHTPRAKKAIELSIEEARSLNHNYVGTEHLLLGLIREEEGVAAQLLLNHGVALGGAREKVLELVRPESATAASMRHGDTEFIVAEVSKNWPDPAASPDIISKRFELVIERNRRRGYELHSWQFNRVVVPESPPDYPGAQINESIVAVFRRATPPAAGKEGPADAPPQAG